MHKIVRIEDGEVLVWKEVRSWREFVFVSGDWNSLLTVYPLALRIIVCVLQLYYGQMNTKEKEQLVSEVNILRELSHKHVVRYYDRIIDREAKKIYIVMEHWYTHTRTITSVLRVSILDVLR